MKINLPSGAVLDITLMPFERAWEISQTVIKEIEKIDADIGFLLRGEFDPSELIKLKGPICSLLSNRVIVNMAKECFVKCAINGLRIDDQTFETPSMRGDFIFAAFHVLVENISPFFKNLGSFFTKLSEQMIKSDTQK